jgi:uncharacterized repeat protein (TIGR01451 family)
VSSNPTVAPSGGTLTWNHGTIAASGSATFTVTLTPPAGGGLVNNSVSATTTTFDGDASNNTDALATTVNPAANVGVTMSAAPDPVNAGDIVTYTITVTNPLGPSPSQGVMVNVIVPGTGTFVDATGGATPTGLSLQFPVFDLGVGGTEVREFRWQAPLSGSLASSVTVSTATADPDPANNNASVSPAVAGADLGVAISAPVAVAGAESFDYTITVTNNGPGRAQNVTVTSQEPSNASFLGALPAPSSTNPLTWNVTQLDAFEDTVFVVSLTAPLLGDVTMTAGVSASTTDLTPGNNSATAATTVNPLASDLEIKVTPDVATVVSGGTVTYTIELTNNGPGGAVGVSLTGSVTNGTITSGLPANFLLMASGETQTITATVTAGAAGTDVSLTLTAIAATPDPNGATAVVNTPVT